MEARQGIRANKVGSGIAGGKEEDGFEALMILQFHCED